MILIFTHAADVLPSAPYRYPMSELGLNFKLSGVSVAVDTLFSAHTEKLRARPQNCRHARVHALDHVIDLVNVAGRRGYGLVRMA